MMLKLPFAQAARGVVGLFVGLFLPLLAGAQSLEGTWFLAGEYFEVNGGLTVTKNGDLETGTITFDRTGGDNYRVTVNTTDVEVLNLTITQSGGTFNTSTGEEEDGTSISRNDIRIE